MNDARSGLRIAVRAKGSGLADALSKEGHLVVRDHASKSRGLSVRSAPLRLDFRSRKCSRAESSGRVRVDRIPAVRTVGAQVVQVQIEVEIAARGLIVIRPRGLIVTAAEAGAAEASGGRAKAASDRHDPRARAAARHVAVHRAVVHRALVGPDGRAAVIRGVDLAERLEDLGSRDFAEGLAADRRGAIADKLEG